MQTHSPLSGATAPLRTWPAVLGVNMTILMATLDVSIVNVALPTLVKELGTDFATVQWVMVSYLLVVTSLMLSASRLGDMLGKKRLFIIGLVVFTLASLLCGLAWDVGSLIVFRALQGVGAVGVQALGAAIITEIVPREQLGKAMGFIGGTVSLGLSAGPSIGGLLIGLAGWRSIFLVNVPIGLLAWWIIQREVPQLQRPQERETFDFAGAVTLFLSLGCFALGLTRGQQQGFDQPTVLGLLAVAACLLLGFLWWQLRCRHPMLDLSLFRNKLFSLNLAMSYCVFVGLGYIYILPFFFQLAQGYGPEAIGLLLVVVPGTMGLVSPLAGMLSDRWGARGVSIGGLLLFIVGALSMTTLEAQTPWWGFVLRAIPIGLGIGFFQAPNNSAIMGQAPRNRLGVVSGLMNYSRTIGQTTGIPVMGAVFTGMVLGSAALPRAAGLGAAPAEALTRGLSVVFAITAGLGCVALALALVAYGLDRQRAAAVAPQANKE